MLPPGSTCCNDGDDATTPKVVTVSENGDTKTKDKKKKNSAQKKKSGSGGGGPPQKKQEGGLTSTEERQEGSVAGSAYLHYARAGGVCAFFSMFLIQGVGRASEICASFWIAHWTSKAIEASENGTPLTDENNTYYINIYAAFGMFGVAGLTIRSILMALHRLSASRHLHENLTTSIMRAPVSFFDGEYITQYTDYRL